MLLSRLLSPYFIPQLLAAIIAAMLLVYALRNRSAPRGAGILVPDGFRADLRHRVRVEPHQHIPGCEGLLGKDRGFGLQCPLRDLADHRPAIHRERTLVDAGEDHLAFHLPTGLLHLCADQ